MLLLCKGRQLQEFITNLILMDEGRRKENLPTWIENEHGVKSCFPRARAEKLVRKNYGWKFTTPETVPAKKQYPLSGGELRESGLNRRKAAREANEIIENRPAEEKTSELDQLSFEDVKTRAKKLGIDKYWCKSEARLRREVAEAEV
jgi:hypothetical protein